MNAQETNNALEQAKAQANSIAQMVAALHVDYDQLEWLKDELHGLEYDLREVGNPEEEKEAAKALAEWRAEYAEELAELEEAANGCKDADEARERIQEDALDVQYRSGWHNVGETLEAAEFSILLCTGGPAVRIMGELDEHMQPSRAWLEYQDWITPWQEAVGVIEQSTLLEYCQQFCFGE